MQMVVALAVAPVRVKAHGWAVEVSSSVAPGRAAWDEGVKKRTL